MRNFLLLSFMVCLTSACESWVPVEVYKNKRCNTAIAADFDKNGVVEIIYCAENKLWLTSSDGKRTREIHAGEYVIHSAAGDLDGDGDIDYIGGLKKVVWLECPKDIWKDEWKFRVISDKLGGSHAVEAVDVDKDGTVDVVANNFNAKGNYPNSICWFKKSGDSWTVHSIAKEDAFGGSHYFKIFDLNGKRALCVGNKGKPFKNGNYFALYESQDSVKNPWKKTVLLKDMEGATNIFPADLDKDGKVDYVLANGHGKGIRIIQGSDSKVLDIDLEMACPHSLDVGDIDGDGDLDIATCGYLSAEVAWYENKGGMKFVKHSLAKNQKSYDVRIVDINGDGKKDILVAGQGSNNVIWFRQ